MKKLIVILAVLFSFGVSAQENAKNTDPKKQQNTAHLMMTDNKVMLIQGGTMQILEHDMKLNNGTTVTTSGKMIAADGKTTMMTNGDMISTAGVLTKRGNLKAKK